MTKTSNNIAFILHQNITSNALKARMLYNSKELFSDDENPLLSNIGSETNSIKANETNVVESALSSINEIKVPIKRKEQLLFILISIFCTLLLSLLLFLGWKIFILGQTEILISAKTFITLATGIITSILLSMHKKERRALAKIDIDLINIHRAQAALGIQNMHNNKQESSSELLVLNPLEEKIIIRDEIS